MALASEKVGIPNADEAPMIVMARYKQPLAGFLSILIRFLLVIGIGTLTFLGYYLLSPILFGDNTNYWLMNPTPFLLWFLWIGILFAYVWRKWPIYRAV